MPIPAQPISNTLFEPLTLGRYQLANRIVMAPMTRCRAIDVNIPSEMTPEYYSQRATAGLIITEATQPSEGAQGYWRTPGIHNERQLDVWSATARAVHARKGRIFMQLWHAGRIFHPDNAQPNVRPVAPSAIAAQVQLVTKNGLQSTSVPHALSTDEIHAITAEFVQAARNAIDCGLDGVEIHAANGYLFEQFLHRSSNQRTDAYGGSLQNRSRFLEETVEAVCAAIGSDRVGVRISPLGTFNDVHDPEPEQIYRFVAQRLSAFDLAYLHVIRPNVSGSMNTAAAPTRDPLPEIRALYRGALIVAGDLDVPTAERLLTAGQADAVGFGRWFISNPDLTERLRHGWPLVEAKRETFYSPGAEGYIDYPTYQVELHSASAK